jgi:hypothetical protein
VHYDEEAMLDSTLIAVIASGFAAVIKCKSAATNECPSWVSTTDSL